MAAIGSLGDVVFSVSRSVVKTFDSLKYDSSAGYVTHKRHLKAPLLEFTGPETENISFTVLLSAFLGCNPKTEADKLRKYLSEGTALRFVLGKNTIGNYRWVITKLSQSDFRIDKNGNMLAVKLSITLNSYEKR